MKSRKELKRVVSGSELLLSIHEIAHWKKSKQQASGVYFLLKGDSVQYIGSSMNVYARIGQHISNGVPFDAATVEFCAEHLRLKREGSYIMKFNPPLNKVIPQWDGRHLMLHKIGGDGWKDPPGIDYAIDG